MTKNNKRAKKPASKVTKTTPATDELVSELLMLVEADDNASSSKEVGDESKRMCFTLGNRQDRVMVVTADEVTITSTSEAHKTVTFNANRWAHFMTALPKIDEEAKELNKKTRSVAYRQHIGDGYYVSVTDGVMCVDIRRFYVPYGLTGEQARPSKSGLALRFDEWVDFIISLDLIHAAYPTLAEAKPCTEHESHLSQRGWLDCTSCFPFIREYPEL